MNDPGDGEFVYQTHRPAQPMDQAVRRIVLWAGGISVLVIVVALLWSGVRATGFGPPPVIQAPPGPLRVAPASPGGLVVPEADEQIMSGDTSGPPPQLAPTATLPDVAQLDQAAGVNQHLFLSHLPPFLPHLPPRQHNRRRQWWRRRNPARRRCNLPPRLMSRARKAYGMG